MEDLHSGLADLESAEDYGALTVTDSGLSLLIRCCVPELATSDVTAVAAAAARYGVTVLPSG